MTLKHDVIGDGKGRTFTHINWRTKKIRRKAHETNQYPILESLRLECEDEIEYKYDFRISNQLRSQSCGFSLLLISRAKGFRNNIGVLFGDLEYALSV